MESGWLPYTYILFNKLATLFLARLCVCVCVQVSNAADSGSLKLREANPDKRPALLNLLISPRMPQVRQIAKTDGRVTGTCQNALPTISRWEPGKIGCSNRLKASYHKSLPLASRIQMVKIADADSRVTAVSLS